MMKDKASILNSLLIYNYLANRRLNKSGNIVTAGIYPLFHRMVYSIVYPAIYLIILIAITSFHIAYVSAARENIIQSKVPTIASVELLPVEVLRNKTDIVSMNSAGIDSIIIKKDKTADITDQAVENNNDDLNGKYYPDPADKDITSKNTVPKNLIPKNIIPKARIAVVDVESIFEHSLAILNIRKSINKISESIQQEMGLKEQELKKKENELIKQRELLSKDEFDSRVALFNQNVSETQKTMQYKKTALENAHTNAMNTVQKTTTEVISKLARKYGFNIVLPSSQVLFVEDELNITLEVITNLNEVLKIVEVEY